MFGTTLRLPGEFFLPEDFTPDQNFFIEEFRELMHQIRPVPVAHNYEKHAFCFNDLYSCTHVLLLLFINQSNVQKYTNLQLHM